VNNGAPDVEELDVGILDLSKKLFKETDVYILDCDTEVFVWMGSRSKIPHRKVGMALSRRLMNDPDRPAWASQTPQVVFSGAESPTFQFKFSDWHRSLKVRILI
jgi:hypothetical protein